MYLLQNIEITMTEQAGLLEFAVCQSYWNMPNDISFDQHMINLIRKFATSEDDINRIVADNMIVVTDICCYSCQRYFLPTTVVDLQAMRHQGVYRCHDCEMAYQAGNIASHP